MYWLEVNVLEINLEKIVGLKIEFAAVDVVVGQVHQCLQLDWSYGLGSHETNDQIHAIGDIAEGQVVCLFGFLSFLHLWTFLCACPCACLCLCLCWFCLLFHVHGHELEDHSCQKLHHPLPFDLLFDLPL